MQTETMEMIEAKEKTKLHGKKALLAILERAANDHNFIAQLTDDSHKALEGNYVLNNEELAALLSGDIRKIESWLGKLSQKQATWLWCRLGQMKY